VPPLKHADGCCFYRFSECLVQAVARHDVSLTAKDIGGVFLHVHEFVNAELALLIVKKEIHVRIVISLTARRRAEHVKMFDAKPLQIGFVLLQPANGFIALHGNIVANPGGNFHVFWFRQGPLGCDARLI